MPPNTRKYTSQSILSEFSPTNIEEITAIITESGIKTSPDDLLPSQIIKDNLEVISPLIVILVNLSLTKASMDGLKSADILPLLKGESLDSNILIFSDLYQIWNLLVK